MHWKSDGNPKVGEEEFFNLKPPNCWEIVRWESEWVMLSFACTNNLSALEQDIYSPISPVEISKRLWFSLEDQRHVYPHECDIGEKRKEGNYCKGKIK